MILYFFSSFSDNFTYVPVILERHPLMDDWEDAMQPLLSKYSASFEVEYDQDYLIKVGIFLQCIQNNHD